VDALESGISKYVATEFITTVFTYFEFILNKPCCPWLRLVAGLSPPWPKLVARVDNVGFMADKVALKQFFF
jgi:hypothetical protein